jgi:hypothetical protein
MLELTCPNCRRLLQIVETATDRDSQCPACGVVFRPEQTGTHGAPAERLESAFEAFTDTTLSGICTDFFLEEWRSRAKDRRIRRRLLIPPAVFAMLVCTYIFAAPSTRGFGWLDKLLGAACAASFILLPAVVLIYTLPTLTALGLGFRKAAGRPTKPTVKTSESPPPNDPHFEEWS